jgi:hypothetical protein
MKEIMIAEAIYFSSKKRYTASIRIKPNWISVRPVRVIRKYIGVKITKMIANQGWSMFSFFAVRYARKAVRHPSKTLNNFNP